MALFSSGVAMAESPLRISSLSTSCLDQPPFTRQPSASRQHRCRVRPCSRRGLPLPAGRRRGGAESLHESQRIESLPLLLNFPVCQPKNRNPHDFYPSSGGGNPRERPVMSAARDPARDYPISLPEQVFDGEMNVREGRPVRGDQLFEFLWTAHPVGGRQVPDI